MSSKLSVIEYTVKHDSFFSREEHVGAEVVCMIREAKPGALWVVEDNQPAYEIKIPHPSEMKI